MRTVIIKLGGSLVVPNEVDTQFLKEFKKIIEEYISKDFKFGIVIGGGKICRKYQQAAQEIIGEDQKTIDALGIEVTKLNAHLLKTIFKELADENIITDYSKNIKLKKPVTIGAGYKPDWSTDYDAMVLANHVKAAELIELSNIAHVYDKDPKIYKDARPYDRLKWDEMLTLCKGPWKPGLNSPLDPMAAKEGAKNKQKVVFLAGLENLKNYLDEKSFVGTIIE